ncbi:hypothetical protein BDV96DRAFT_664480 [Lophiotrema nucula]|uniref:Uncharacterized protein n=1 Tax=Lophiotrema nucula TaxID=690887 RepID=A0A6A5Z043_9PLEO|nr:hypothetical protein BDV96DRAFT_664480 [Lophiotrema nucula]
MARSTSAHPATARSVPVPASRPAAAMSPSPNRDCSPWPPTQRCYNKETFEIIFNAWDWSKHRDGPSPDAVNTVLSFTVAEPAYMYKDDKDKAKWAWRFLILWFDRYLVEVYGDYAMLSHVPDWIMTTGIPKVLTGDGTGERGDGTVEREEE